jgi:transposase
VHLAKLLRLDEITPVCVPSVEQETARDLVRAREDCRGDLMRARHRLSKLLLRHGIVYYDGDAWTGKHDAWLRRQRFENPATRLTFESDYDAVLVTTARRNRLDDAIEAMAADSEFTPIVHRFGCLRGISTLTAFALAVEIGDWHRFTGNSIGSFVGWCPANTPRDHRGSRGRSPRPETDTLAGSWSRLPGITGPVTVQARPCASAGSSPPRPPVSAATWATGACTPAG